MSETKKYPHYFVSDNGQLNRVIEDHASASEAEDFLDSINANWLIVFSREEAIAFLDSAQKALNNNEPIDVNPPITREKLIDMIKLDEDVTKVNTSEIKNMSKLFEVNPYFNQDISAWDVSNVTDMRLMFLGAKSFNQDISAWDVSNVTNMRWMFSGAESFNQDISAWDVSNVTDMRWMFSGAESFNQDISAWDVSNVTDMTSMFSGTESFNQDISTWDESVSPR